MGCLKIYGCFCQALMPAGLIQIPVFEGLEAAFGKTMFEPDEGGRVWFCAAENALKPQDLPTALIFGSFHPGKEQDAAKKQRNK